ncbi:MAG TPA: CbiX/SirB N-terminal domain-containing protein [Actinoplanes sp.]|nr:CbiX/SirB N-terminal domain-containing protein [Actinoplanes sp.]
MRPARLTYTGLRRAAAAVGRPPGAGRLAVVLVAHGSRDPRAAESTMALAAAVARAYPDWEVHPSYLDHAGPRPLDVLAGLAFRGHTRAVLVPLLLTAAYHGRVDVPAVVTAAREAGLPIEVAVADVLGPRSGVVPRFLLDGLIRRLPEAGLDAVVLAAAGTRDAAARTTVEDVAAALGERLGVPYAVAYASAASLTPAEAVGELRAGGAIRVGVAAYFLAPGLLYDVAAESARSAGAVAVSDPLGDAPELVRLVASRVDAGALVRLPAA